MLSQHQAIHSNSDGHMVVNCFANIGSNVPDDHNCRTHLLLGIWSRTNKQETQSPSSCDRGNKRSTFTIFRGGHFYNLNLWKIPKSQKFISQLCQRFQIQDQVHQRKHKYNKITKETQNISHLGRAYTIFIPIHTAPHKYLHRVRIRMLGRRLWFLLLPILLMADVCTAHMYGRVSG